MGLPGEVLIRALSSSFTPRWHLPERWGLPRAVCREGLPGPVGPKWCTSLWVWVLALPALHFSH